MLPDSLSIIDLADIGWERIAADGVSHCVRTPLRTTSGNSLDVSVFVWTVESCNLSLPPNQTSESGFSWIHLKASSESVTEAGYRDHWMLLGPKRTTFVAAIPSELILDRIIAEYGPPPPVITRDWNRQVGTPSQKRLTDQPLSCIAIRPDGMLYPILDRYVNHSLNLNSEEIETQTISDPALIDKLNQYADVLATSEALIKTDRTENTFDRFSEVKTQTLREFLNTPSLEGSNLSRDTDSAKNILPSDSSARAKPGESDLPLSPLLANASSLPASSLALKGLQHNVTPKNYNAFSKRNAWTARRIAPSLIVLLIAAIGLGYMLIPATPKPVTDSGAAQVTPRGTLAPDDSSPSVDLIANGDSTRTANDDLSVPNASDMDLKLTEGTSTSEVSSVPTLNADLASELSAKLTQGMKDDIDGEGVIDPSKIESITSLLSPKDSTAVLPMEIESKMNSDRDLKSLDASFSDSGDNGTASMDASMPNAGASERESPALDVPLASEEQAGVSKIVSIALKRPIQKEELRIPFSVNAKTASVQAQWELPEEILITPEAPVMITGKQEQSWTIALKDESSKLIVTVKSKPNRKWLIGTVIKLVGENGVEFPIAPGDATLMQQQLMARSKEITKQTQFLELVKSAKGGRAFASYYMPLAEASLKQTELAIQQWSEIDELVNQFYQSHKLNLTFHANATLPPQ